MIVASVFAVDSDGACSALVKPACVLPVSESMLPKKAERSVRSLKSHVTVVAVQQVWFAEPKSIRAAERGKSGIEKAGAW